MLTRWNDPFRDMNRLLSDTFGGYGRGYGAYNGYVPRAAYVPYGAGYSGGWQPYQGYYYQQPRFGVYLGF